MSKRFAIKLPSGATFHLQELDQAGINVLKTQCPDQEILRLESIGVKTPQIYNYSSENKRKGWFSSTQITIHKFLDEHKKPPPPGNYRMILSENQADVDEYGICGTAIEALKQDRTFGEKFGQNCSLSIPTQPNAGFKYCIAVVFDKLIVALEFDAHNERLLDIKPPVELNKGGQRFGAVSGWVHNLAAMLPFESMLGILLHPALQSVETIIFTGHGWSGTIAHCSAIIFRKILEECNACKTVKAVSFNGPLCGSTSLVNYINRSDNTLNHTTIGDASILDRLILDLQKLSPLVKEPETFQMVFFISLKIAMKQWQLGDAHSIDASCLTNAEASMANHVTMSEDTMFLPIGRYLLSYNAESVSKTDPSEIQTEIQSLRGNQVLKNLRFTVNDVHKREAARIPVFFYSLKPKLSSLKIHATKYRITLTFHGENLDCVKGRLVEKEINLNNASPEDVPYRFSRGGIKILHDSKLTAIIPSSKKVIVEIINCEIVDLTGNVTIFTDFGESNSIQYQAQDVVRGEESAPSKALHPTMNAEFLSAAVLRIAIVCKKSKGLAALDETPEFRLLWKMLLDIENGLCPTPTLELYVRQYLFGENDISTMRNQCITTLGTIALKTVEDFHFKENIFIWGGRKVTGVISTLAGGLLLAAGLILALPTTLLMTPVFMSTPEDLEAASAARQAGVIALTGTAAILSIPSLIVGAIGAFLFSAGSYALHDRESLKYKTILKSLLDAMGEDSQNVVDELSPLEAKVVETFQGLVPGLLVHLGSQKEIYDAICLQVTKGKPRAESLKMAIDATPILKQKLWLVCRINMIRQILEHNLMIAFVGVHNAGKSTTINRLFGADTGADLIVRTEEPTGYQMGQWITKAKSSNSSFREWYAKQGCSALQLYAVDFPGTTDERQVVGLITRYTAELASMFVVILKAGHIAMAEKEVVRVAKNNHKPFIVVINHVDTIKNEVATPAGFERIRASYARILEIPESSLLFMSALDGASIVRLRGTIFSMVHNLLGNASLSNALPLHFISDRTMEELQCNNNVLDTPQDLCDVVSSMLYNSIALSAGALLQGMKQRAQIQFQNQEQRQAAVTASALHPMRQKVLSLFRQLACMLHMSDQVYSVATDLFLANCETIQGQIERQELLPDAKNGHTLLETLVTVYALGQLNDSLKDYFTDGNKTFQSAVPDETLLGRVTMEVMLGLNAIFSLWGERGQGPKVIQQALRQICISTNCSAFDDTDMCSVIQEITTRAGLLGGTDESPSKERLSLESSTGHSIDGTALHEFEKYQRARMHYQQLSSLTFATFANMEHNHRGRGLLPTFRNAVNLYVAQLRNLQVVEIEPDAEKRLTTCVLDQMMKIDKRVLRNCDIRFKIRSDDALDANGVTKSVLTTIANEINETPNLVGLMKHEGNGFLYFDTSFCYCLGEATLKKHKTTYRALGRLIGLTIAKSTLNVTLPINFPITFYKWLLGYRIGLSDLEVIAPELSRSINNMCLMEDHEFDSLGLTMCANLSDKSPYEFEPNGRDYPVTATHRNDFLRLYLQFHLCCLNGEETRNLLQEILLGVQDVCPRDMFHQLPPISLQMIVEGTREIDADDWMLYTSVKHTGRTSQITVDYFREIITEMTNEERTLLLCFTTGSAALPAGGFSALNPEFTLVIGTSNVDSLPEAHTCFNILIIPQYKDKAMMKEKLLTACRETKADQFGMR